MEENVKFSAFGSLRATESKIVDVDEIVRLIKYDDGIAKKTALYRQMAQNVSRETAKKEIKEIDLEEKVADVKEDLQEGLDKAKTVVGEGLDVVQKQFEDLRKRFNL